MGFFATLFGATAAAPIAATAKPIDAVGNALDKLFTSDDERAAAAVVMEKLRQQPAVLQVEINKLEAVSRIPFVAGWRPAIGWVCALGLLFPFVINPLFQWYTGQAGPQLPLDQIMNLVIALLGLGGYRSYEKKQGLTK